MLLQFWGLTKKQVKDFKKIKNKLYPKTIMSGVLDNIIKLMKKEVEANDEKAD